MALVVEGIAPAEIWDERLVLLISLMREAASIAKEARLSRWYQTP
jgi:hypothetical protein